MSKKGLMYRKWLAIGMVSYMLVLSGCTPGHRIEDQESWHNGTMPDGFSFASLGRTLSGGTVDLFDPYANSFENMPLPPKKPPVISADFAKHATYMPADDNVIFYALTSPADDLEVIEPKPLVMPIPLENGDE